MDATKRVVKKEAPNARRDEGKAPVKTVIVVAQDAVVANAAVSWKERYERVLAANQRLKNELRTREAAHRKAMTTVKYEQSLPNNDTFTRQLVDENRALVTRIRVLELRLFRVGGTPATPSERTNRATKPRRARSRSVQTDAASALSPSSSFYEGKIVDAVSPSPALVSLLGDLKARLGELELDLERLHQENELLRQSHNQQTHSASDEKASAVQHEGSQEKLKPTNGADTAAAVGEARELERSLRDQMRQMGLLEARYHLLEDKARAKAELYKQTVAHAEQLQEQLFEAQQRILDQTATIERHQDQTAHMEELQSETHLLRSENMKLNDAIATLSARPFDALSMDLQTKNLYIAQLESTIRDLEQQREHAVQDVRVAKQTSEQLRGRVKRLLQELQEQADTLAQAERECEQHKMAKELAELQLRFYTVPGDHALMCALGKALKDTRKQQDAHAASFMEPVDSNAHSNRGDSANATLPTHDKNAVSTMEKKRLEKVSELTQLLQEDTQAQLQSLTLRHTQEKQLLKRESEKWKQRATTYLEQVRSLQRENGELLQRIGSEPRLRRMDGGSKIPRDAATIIPKSEDGHPIRTDSDHESKSTSVDAPAMNTLEVVVSELHVTKDTEWAWTRDTHSQQQPHRSYALLCDYYDFESQISPVISLYGNGTSADNSIIVPLDFGITYKTWQDAAFFKTPIAHHVRIELHQVVVGYTELVGVADCDLQALFLSPTGQCTMTFKLRRPHPHSNPITLGSLTVTLTLTRPVDMFFKSLARNNNYRSNLMAPVSSTRSATMASPSLTHLGRLSVSRKGVIHIRIVSCLLLKTFFISEFAKPSREVERKMRLSYRFVGFPRVVVPIVVPREGFSKGGVFVVVSDNGRSFEVDASVEFQTFLRQYVLELQCQHTSTPDAATSVFDNVHAQGSISWSEVMQQLANHPAGASFSTIVFPSLYAANEEQQPSSTRVLARLAIEISTQGFPTAAEKAAPVRFLPFTSPRIKHTIQRLFACFVPPGAKNLVVNWTKFCAVMHMSPLQKVLRHLLYRNKPPTVTNASALLTKVRAARAKVDDACNGELRTASNTWFHSVEALKDLLMGSGIHLSAIDLAMFHAGLLHNDEEERREQQSTSNCNKRVVDGVLGNAVAELSKRWQKLELICETWDDEWLAIEDLLRQRANALGSLRSEAPCDDANAACRGSNSRSDLTPPKMVTVSWDAFESRLGLASISDSTWHLHVKRS